MHITNPSGHYLDIVLSQSLALTKKWKISTETTRIRQPRPRLYLSLASRAYFPIFN
jgi:hypothetical protein